MSFFHYVAKYSQPLGAFASLVAGATIMVPHNLLQGQFRQFHQLYKDGVATPLGQHLEDMSTQILRDAGTTAQQEVNTSIFLAFDQDPVHTGSLKMRMGTSIGLPANLTYNSLEDMEKTKILLGNKHVDWSSPSGQKFAESLLLSDSAKKFVIAREVKHVMTQYAMWQSLMALGFAFSTYSLAFVTNTVMGLRVRASRPVRFIVYGLIGGATGTLYILAKDAYNCRKERQADAAAAEMGREYAAGGVEYYQKVLERNIAMRTLMEKEGNKFYTPYGNKVVFWRAQALPFSNRLDNLKTHLKKYDEAEKS